jgi:hypothetical protein
MEALLAIFIFVIGLIFIVRLLLGKAIFVEVAGLWIHDISKFLIKASIKIVGYVFSQLARLVRLLINR